MFPEIHPKIAEALSFIGHGTIIDGAFATQAFDTSGELINIAGVDISSLNEDGTLNSEHVNPDTKNKDSNGGQWSPVVGRVIFAKKIFNEQDCESERELFLWKTLLIPFIYGAGELFDSENHENAKAVAAIIAHYHKRNLPVTVRYSIEGSTLERQGQHLLKTLARRVALTIKPCNKSSYNYLVAEATPKQISIEKNETGFTPYISVFEMDYAPMLENPIDSMKTALNNLKDLNKTFTLGGSNLAPSALTQGAATSVEDVDKKKFIKNQVLAAFRDWDKSTSFKDFLKHRLPDANDEFIERFSHLADEIKVMKYQNEVNSLNKQEDPILGYLDEKIPSGAKMFKNKHVIPGEIEIIAGPVQGSKLKLLHLDDNYAWVKPFKAGENEVNVNKLNRKLEGSHFQVLKHPEVLNIPNYVNGNKHLDKSLTETHKQKQLIHGIDLASTPLVQTHPNGSTEARTKGVIGWFKSANGNTGYVKPAVNYWDKVKNEKESLDSNSEEYLSTAKREVIFHNVANNYFQLGEYVPTTALFNHPQDGHDHSVMELIPFATHTKLNSKSHESVVRLLQAGDTGVLDKLAIMDTVMGNPDRERINYMTSPNPPHIHLIDNALIFNFSDSYIPAYLSDYHHFKKIPLDSANLHPEAIKWLISLDPFALGIELARQGVHQKIINQAVTRLLSIQSEAVLGVTNKNRLLFAHSRFSTPMEIPC